MCSILGSSLERIADLEREFVVPDPQPYRSSSGDGSPRTCYCTISPNPFLICEDALAFIATIIRTWTDTVFGIISIAVKEFVPWIWLPLELSAH